MSETPPSVTEALKPASPDGLPAHSQLHEETAATRERTSAAQVPARQRLAALPSRVGTVSGLLSEDTDDNSGLERVLNDYLDSVDFTDKTFTTETLAADIKYATGEGHDKPDRKLSPVPADITARMRVLNADKNQGRTFNTATANIGGSNTNAAATEVSIGKRRKITAMPPKHSFRDPSSTDPLRCDDYKDYFKKTVPQGYLKQLREAATSGEPVVIGLGLAFPTSADGRAIHASSKFSFERNPLAPFDDREAREVTDTTVYPTIAQAFAEFLQEEGITISSEAISIGDNDTILIIIGAHEEAQKLLETPGVEGVIGLVCGTGYNECYFILGEDGSLKGYNLELGHYQLSHNCLLEQVVCDDAEKALDLEGYVSSAITAESFKLSLQQLIPGSPLCSQIQKLDRDTLNAFVFGYGTGQPLPELFSETTPKEQFLLHHLCSAYAERAAQYMATTLRAICLATGKNMVCIKEGSVVDHNPGLVRRVNEIVGRDILVDLPPLEAEDATGTGINIAGLPPSFWGTGDNAIANKLLKEEAEGQPRKSGPFYKYVPPRINLPELEPLR